MFDESDDEEPPSPQAPPRVLHHRAWEPPRNTLTTLGLLKYTNDEYVVYFECMYLKTLHNLLVENGISCRGYERGGPEVVA